MNHNDQHAPMPDQQNHTKNKLFSHVSEALWIALICLVLITLAAVLLYFFPRRISIDQTVIVNKFDALGNSTGTVQIQIQGDLLDYFILEDRIVLEIAPFDDLTSIQTNGNGGYLNSYVDRNTGAEFYQVHLQAWNTSVEDIAYCILLFSTEFDCMVLHSNVSRKEDSIYIASIIENDTVSDILKYFNILPTAS